MWKLVLLCFRISLVYHSNVKLHTSVQVTGQFSLQSLRVIVNMRETNKGRGYSIFKLANIVLPYVEDERSQGEVGDVHRVADQKSILASCKLILNDGQELFQDSFSDLLEFSGLGVISLNTLDTCDLGENFGVGVENDVVYYSRSPVFGVVVSVLNAEGTQNSVGLLSTLASKMDDRHPVHLTAVASGFPREPGLPLKANQFIVYAFMRQQLNDRVGSAVSLLEVLNLDFLT